MKLDATYCALHCVHLLTGACAFLPQAPHFYLQGQSGMRECRARAGRENAIAKCIHGKHAGEEGRAGQAAGSMRSYSVPPGQSEGS
jgi:hypothetical protein